LLVAVADYSIGSAGKPPDNLWLRRRLHLPASAISNLKRGLKEKGFFRKELKDAALSERAVRFLASRQVVYHTQILVLGEVQAGRTKQDEIAVEIRDLNYLDDDDVPTITFPHIENASSVFALEVRGDSMMYEHIFNGDYVIVQRFNENEKPKQGELIVTRYLAVCDEESVDPEQISAGANIPHEYLEGPTIKRYYEKEGFYRLSWRKDHNKSEYTIKTKYIHPVGRVIGVYRVVDTNR